MAADEDSEEYARRALLPAGFHDVLPPMAEVEADVVARLTDCFGSFGYERVNPPLIEFEDSLLAFDGAKHATQSFRVLDPDSRRMMAVRADMTLQIARIATTRLKDAARPLRLSYAGPVLRVKGSQLRPSRQFHQAGVELIGSRSIAADVEVISMAHAALRDIGVSDPTIDLATPTLLPAIADDLGLEPDQLAEVVTVLDSKEAGQLERFSDRARDTLQGLLASSGEARDVLEKLAALDLPAPARPIIDTLGQIIDRLRHHAPDLRLTVDPCETRGFEYKTGVAFSIFAGDARSELGRGGRYRAAHPGGKSEDAVGFSIYLDSVMQAVRADQPRQRVYAPHGSAKADIQALRQEGWRIVQALESEGDARGEAVRLGCTHILGENGQLHRLSEISRGKG